jgi:hypothetical protein
VASVEVYSIREQRTWRKKSTYSKPQNYMEARDQPHTVVTSHLGKELLATSKQEK